MKCIEGLSERCLLSCSGLLRVFPDLPLVPTRMLEEDKDLVMKNI